MPQLPSWPVRASLSAFVGVLCLAGLAGGDLVRNEGLRARLAAEALATGGWLVPTLSGEPHLAKPPGMSLAIGLCSLPAGRVTPLTARLPSVAAGLLVVWWFYRAFRPLGPAAALAAAAIVPCSALWLERAPSAEIDLVQLAWVSGSLLCLLRAAGPPEDSGSRLHDWFWWFAALACVAGGLFTKWTAPAFFYLTAVPFLACQGRLSLLFRPPHLAAAGLVAAVALAWLAFVAYTAGAHVLLDTLGREALLRLSPGHHPRPYPWGELLSFPLSFLAACLPWSAFALCTLAPGFWRLCDGRGRQLLLLCHAWLWPNLLFWTLAPGHRPRHLLPAQPAVAGLAALVWAAWLTGRLRWPVARLRPAAALVGLLAAGLAVKLAFVGVVWPARQARRSPRPGGEALARLVPHGETLYVFRLKDEGVLFYYGRRARRLAGPDALPPGRAWCLLTGPEWQRWHGRAEPLATLPDGQGAALRLVRWPARREVRR
jgi:4-amino-4-deoxy-L-arabinose transferase-like glycosyltransferase